MIAVQYRTVGDEPLPLLESIERWYRTSCGQAGWDAVAGIERLIAAARAAGAPVIYPYVAPKAKIDGGRTGEKIPSLMDVPERGYEFVAETVRQLVFAQYGDSTYTRGLNVYTTVRAEQSSSSGGPSRPPSGNGKPADSQINGCSWGPENTGPAAGWLTSES